jgi:acyl carrier protein
MELEKLKAIIAEVAGVHIGEIMLGTTFIEDLGVDSLDVYQIIMGIEQTFDIEITAEQAETVVTIEDAVNLIKDAIG